MKKLIYIKTSIKLLLPILFIIVSCSKKETTVDKDNLTIPEGYAHLKVEVASIDFQEEKLGGIKKASAKLISPTNSITLQNNLTGKGISCDVSLEPISTSSNKLKSTIHNNKQAATVTEPVSKDVRYRLYIYDKASGLLVASGAYIRGDEGNAAPILIQGGKEYTVVAYSINSKTDYPAELENAQNINTAEITNGQVEFMYQKQDISVANNTNQTLKLKFRHQFAQINTIVRLDASTSQYTHIRGASAASYFKPTYAKTKFKVSNSNISAVELSPQGSPVAFPFIPFTDLTVKSITSLQPTILNTPTSITNGTFTIEALTIGDVTRHVEVSGLNLLPGVKYNLVLTFNVPETTIIGANPHFKFYDETTNNTPFTHTVLLENPTFGAQIDIWFLDNSFNLKINGVNLFSRELNFEGLRTNQGRHDVFFSDNTYYNDAIFSTGNIDYIFRINPTRQEIPVVRLTIDENGNVRLYGRKNMNQSLRDLEIRNGVTINPLAKLNPSGMNTLVFSSTRWTITDVEGRIYGIRIKE